MKEAIILIILFTIGACQRIMPEDYLKSATAPEFGEVVDDVRIDQFLDSLKIPESLRFFAIYDSIPNRTRFTPTGLLFKGKDSLFNKRFCNSEFRNIIQNISFYDSPNYLYKAYSLQDELSAIVDIDIKYLRDSKYYLVFYWSLRMDNLYFRHIKNLHNTIIRDDFSLVILFVNVDNRVQHNQSPEAYRQFLFNNRTKFFCGEDSRWF